jgi:hypothetical protein
MRAVKQAAKAHISAPITKYDIEVEILYSTFTKKGKRADIDNVIKPTLDALKDVASKDDIQVRSVTGTLFDRNKDSNISGRVEYIKQLFYSPDKETLLISIYSDSRLEELGGEDAVKKMRLEQWDKELSSKLKRLKST